MMPKLLISTTIPLTIKAFLLPYADHFRKKGWQVDALTGEGPGLEKIFRYFDQTFTVKWSRNPLELKNLLGAPNKIQKIVEQNDYDLVHVHTPVASFVTRFALRKFRMKGKPKVIYTAHGFHFYSGGPFFLNFIYKTLEKWASRWTDHLFVINEEDYQAACSFMDPASVTYLSGGIGLDLSEYDPVSVPDEKVDVLHKEFSIDGNTPLFLMIAEFNKQKNHSDLIHAFAEMKNQDPMPHLAFAGSGPLEEEMKKLAQKLDVKERIHFLGYRKDVRTLLRAAWALVLPSCREGLPRCVMEAVVMGTPVIGSDIRGTRDLVQLSKGRIFPVGDVRALTGVLEESARSSHCHPVVDEKLRQVFNVERIAEMTYEKIIRLFHVENSREKGNAR